MLTKDEASHSGAMIRRARRALGADGGSGQAAQNGRRDSNREWRWGVRSHGDWHALQSGAGWGGWCIDQIRARVELNREFASGVGRDVRHVGRAVARADRQRRRKRHIRANAIIVGYWYRAARRKHDAADQPRLDTVGWLVRRLLSHDRRTGHRQGERYREKASADRHTF